MGLIESRPGDGESQNLTAGKTARERIMLGGYVKSTSNCGGLPLGWDAGIEILEELGSHKAAIVKVNVSGRSLVPRRIVGWTDLYFGQACSINAYRAKLGNGAEGILICGGNSGIRILAKKSDPEQRDASDKHLPNGWGMPILWVEEASDLVNFEDED
jgi:hypothetical protein